MDILVNELEKMGWRRVECFSGKCLVKDKEDISAIIDIYENGQVLLDIEDSEQVLYFKDFGKLPTVQEIEEEVEKFYRRVL